MNYQVFKLYLYNINKKIEEIHIYEPNNINKNIDEYISEFNISSSLKSKIKIHKLTIYYDDTIENVKYKLASILEDKFYYNYYFFHKIFKENIDFKKIFLNISNEENIISKDKFLPFGR